MIRIKKLAPRYCIWFVTFFKEVVAPRSQTLFFYGMLAAIKDFANIAAFFIPLKVIMVLSNPNILSSGLFALDSIPIEKFIIYAGILFFFLMFISLACHLALAVFVHKSARLLWQEKSTEFPSRTKYKNLYQLLVDTIMHVLIMTIGLASVLFLDAYLSIPIIVIILGSFAASILLSSYTKGELLSSPLKNPRLIFKLLSDIGFSLTFVFIIIGYYFNNDINFLYTLLAVLLSRIIFRHTQQLFIKHRRLFEDYYIQRECKLD